jgi:hypothetical protein
MRLAEIRRCGDAALRCPGYDSIAPVLAHTWYIAMIDSHIITTQFALGAICPDTPRLRGGRTAGIRPLCKC